MTTEFNLSEKMEVTILFDSRYGKNKTFVYREADVKEFISKETHLINEALVTGDWRGFWAKRSELAGEKLI